MSGNIKFLSDDLDQTLIYTPSPHAYSEKRGNMHFTVQKNGVKYKKFLVLRMGKTGKSSHTAEINK